MNFDGYPFSPLETITKTRFLKQLLSLDDHSGSDTLTSSIHEVNLGFVMLFEHFLHHNPSKQEKYNDISFKRYHSEKGKTDKDTLKRYSLFASFDCSIATLLYWDYFFAFPVVEYLKPYWFFS
jgi:hypothetical protein